MAILLGISIYTSCIATVVAQEEKNLDLNTEDASRENNKSLIDDNGIPIFSDNYKDTDTGIFNQEDIFIIDFSVIQGDVFDKKELFQDTTPVNTKVAITASTTISIGWYIMIAGITIAITAIATKVYQKNKYKERVNHDSNIYK